jgi:hypothetical protein
VAAGAFVEVDTAAASVLVEIKWRRFIAGLFVWVSSVIGHLIPSKPTENIARADAPFLPGTAPFI